MNMRLVSVRINSEPSKSESLGIHRYGKTKRSERDRECSARYSRYTNLINRLSYDTKNHVIESNVAAGVSYVVSGNTVGITTAQNGSLTMPYSDFQQVVEEADEVFRFWTEAVG